MIGKKIIATKSKPINTSYRGYRGSSIQEFLEYTIIDIVLVSGETRYLCIDALNFCSLIQPSNIKSIVNEQKSPE